MSDEAERAWWQWAKEHGFDAGGLTWTHEAFRAGFEAGADWATNQFYLTGETEHEDSAFGSL